MGQQELTVVVDGLDQNLSLADCEVVEAILAFTIPIDGVVWIGCCLRGDATSTTSDDTCYAHVVLMIIIFSPKLLIMAVTCD